MILQVAARDLPAAVQAVLEGEDVHAVETAEAARNPPENPELVVLDRHSIEDADAFIRWLRGPESPDAKLPVVLLVETGPPEEVPLLAYDEVVRLPAEETVVRTAVRTAIAVTGYREAVTDLFDECLTRAQEGNGPVEVDDDVKAARDRADDRLADLPNDPEVFAALLKDPSEENEDS